MHLAIPTPRIMRQMSSPFVYLQALNPPPILPGLFHKVTQPEAGLFARTAGSADAFFQDYTKPFDLACTGSTNTISVLPQRCARSKDTDILDAFFATLLYL